MLNNIFVKIRALGPIKTLLLILALALALRAGRCLLVNRIEKDAYLYVSMARLMADGEVDQAFNYNPRIPPLYISLMAFGQRCGVDAEKIGLLISVLCGTLLVLPVFLIARMIFNDKLALTSAFLVAIHPALVRLSVEILRDNLYLFLAFLGIACGVKAIIDKKRVFWYVFGVCVGLATLTRSEGNEFLVALPLWLFLETCFAPEERLKTFLNGLFNLGRFIAAFLLVTIPVQLLLIDSPSVWTVIDGRIVYFMQSIAKLFTG